jgi:hypothetical protein
MAQEGWRGMTARQTPVVTQWTPRAKIPKRWKCKTSPIPPQRCFLMDAHLALGRQSAAAPEPHAPSHMVAVKESVATARQDLQIPTPESL